MDTSGLLVSRKAEALLEMIYPALKNFPKSEKYCLCSEIKSNFYSLISNLEIANSVPSLRKQYAQKADGNLQTIKILMRLARTQKYISKGYYEKISDDLAEINKLLHGYIKSASR